MSKDGQGYLALAAFSAWWSPGGDPEPISAEELLRQIEAGDAPPIIDVRSEGEYRAGHIAGALHIPQKEVEARVAEIPGEGDEPIVVYCAIGPRAVWALRSLRKAGRSKLLLLEGHFTKWKKNGLPFET